ncbi:hypothetical protein STXM2123_5789 [Streptomyces sp. F-3]|nr:hypothetical protein STXM2123_5789 [Streptomyces sp. F-3]
MSTARTARTARTGGTARTIRTGGTARRARRHMVVRHTDPASARPGPRAQWPV